MSELSFPKMNPEFKRAWIEALRSGKYRQGTAVLRNDGAAGGPTHCCLGVLCEVVEAAFEPYDGFLPADVRVLTDFNSGMAETLLVQMNDDGAPFSEIAAWIEKHL